MLGKAPENPGTSDKLTIPLLYRRRSKLAIVFWPDSGADERAFLLEPAELLN